VDVARDAMRMTSSGRSVAEIRATIERTYAPRFPSMTPTPTPPMPVKQ
jgi:hypothetical protein